MQNLIYLFLNVVSVLSSKMSWIVVKMLKVMVCSWRTSPLFVAGRRSPEQPQSQYALVTTDYKHNLAQLSRSERSELQNFFKNSRTKQNDWQKCKQIRQIQQSLCIWRNIRMRQKIIFKRFTQPLKILWRKMSVNLLRNLDKTWEPCALGAKFKPHKLPFARSAKSGNTRFRKPLSNGLFTLLE